MKTPEEWMEEWFPSNDSPNWPIVFTKAHIEAIQRDALNSSFANTSDEQEVAFANERVEMAQDEIKRLKHNIEVFKERWHQARRYLRAANKGAQRNHEAMTLAQARYWDIIRSDKRWKERDLFQHKTIVWNWLMLSDEDLRLKCGELSAQDIRNIRAVLRGMLGSDIKLSHQL
jgi:hypothetical protein